MSVPSSPRQWHIAHWPPLAWLETVIKLIALIIGIAALVGALAGGDFDVPEGGRLVQTILLAVLSLGLVGAIGDRLIEREIVAMIFVIVNSLGHWGMVVALLSAQDVSTALPLFCALMLAGDVVKLVFVRVHQFSVRNAPPAVLYGLVLIFIAGYAVILLIEAMG